MWFARYPWEGVSVCEWGAGKEARAGGGRTVALPTWLPGGKLNAPAACPIWKRCGRRSSAYGMPRQRLGSFFDSAMEAQHRLYCGRR